MPDFRGNRYMNTLGNLLAEPRAALLFIDFERGDVLHLQGKTQILWQAEGHPGVEGAERYWRFDVHRAAFCGGAAVAGTRSGIFAGNAGDRGVAPLK